MSWALLILAGVLFVLLVVVHEFGHFIAARRNGVDVEEFGLGFPPRAKKLGRKNGTLYTLNWLPLGGFVRLKGEHDADTGKGSFGAASLRAKVKIMLAGIGMNLLVAFILLTLLALVGMPVLLNNQFTIARDTHVTRQEVLVGDVEAGSPADKAGLEAHDQLVSLQPVDGSVITISSDDQLPGVTKKLAGQTVVVVVKRDGQTLQKTATLLDAKTVSDSQKTGHPKGYLGVGPGLYAIQRSTWSAPIVAGGLMAQITGATFQGLGTIVTSLFHGHVSQAGAQVTGPVGIFFLLKELSFLGVQFILLIMAFISLSLAIFNVLPIPALDGGRLYLLLFFKAIKKPLSAEREELINGVGFMVLMGLAVLITFLDIKRNI